MAFAAGLKPDEFYSLSPHETWIVIEGHEDNVYEQWEQVRSLAYVCAKFGNSDPKKFPKSLHKFWPLPNDKETPAMDYKAIYAKHAQMKAAREEFEKKKANASRRRNDSNIQG